MATQYGLIIAMYMSVQWDIYVQYLLLDIF